MARRTAESSRDVLVRIKRAVLAGRYAFSEKARMEMEADGITELDVAESILNAVAIYKRLRSGSPRRVGASVVSHKSLDFGCHSERSEESRLFKDSAEKPPIPENSGQQK